MKKETLPKELYVLTLSPFLVAECIIGYFLIPNDQMFYWKFGLYYVSVIYLLYSGIFILINGIADFSKKYIIIFNITLGIILITNSILFYTIGAKGYFLTKIIIALSLHLILSLLYKIRAKK